MQLKSNNRASEFWDLIWMSSLSLDSMQLIQTTTGKLALTRFTTHYLSSCNVDPSHIGNHYFHCKSPTLGSKLLYDFVQANVHARLSCVERNKTSGLTALILYLALENEPEEYNSRRVNPVMNEKKY